MRFSGCFKTTVLILKLVKHIGVLISVSGLL